MPLSSSAEGARTDRYGIASEYNKKLGSLCAIFKQIVAVNATVVALLLLLKELRGQTIQVNVRGVGILLVTVRP